MDIFVAKHARHKEWHTQVDGVWWLVVGSAILLVRTMAPFVGLPLNRRHRCCLLRRNHRVPSAGMPHFSKGKGIVSSQGTATKPVQSMRTRRDPSSGNGFRIRFICIAIRCFDQWQSSEVLSNSELAQVVPFGGRRKKQRQQESGTWSGSWAEAQLQESKGDGASLRPVRGLQARAYRPCSHRCTMYDGVGYTPRQKSQIADVRQGLLLEGISEEKPGTKGQSVTRCIADCRSERSRCRRPFWRLSPALVLPVLWRRSLSAFF